MCRSETRRSTKKDPAASRQVHVFTMQTTGVSEPKKKMDGGKADCLYVLAYEWSGASGPYKVGHTSNLEQRVAQLEASHAFRIIVVAAFEGRGHLEKAVHDRLAHHRSTSGRGREWFNATVPAILRVVSDVIEAEELVRGPDAPVPVLRPSPYFDKEATPIHQSSAASLSSPQSPAPELQPTA